MKKLVALFTLVILFCGCNAQIYRIQKAQAFFTVSMPGMAMQDENGNTINPKPIIDRFIYLECRFNGKPKIDSVFYNGILFTATVDSKEATALKIGIKKNDGNAVTLSRKKGNHIWRIGLQQTAGITLQHAALKIIIFKGRLDKIKFSQAISFETELAAPDRY